MLFPFNNIVIINGVSEPDISIISDDLNYSIQAGDVKTVTIDIENKGNDILNYELTYSSNLMADNNTVGLWYFNDIINNYIMDETTNSNDGLIYGTEIINGKFGKALKFDGINDYVVVPNSPVLNVDSLTMETWIKINPSGSFSPVGGVKYLEYGMLYNEEGIVVPHVWAQGLKWYETNLHISYDEWHYIAMTFDSSTGELAWYQDGDKIDGRNEGSHPIDASENNLIIGRAWTEKMTNYFKGVIDELRISNIPRTPSEIYANYIRGITGEGEWIKVTDYSGVVEPNKSDALELVINASRLAPGKYERDLVLISNDPDTPYVILPINLEVLPVSHDIAVTKIVSKDIGKVEEEFFIDSFISNLGNNKETQIVVELIIDGEVKNSSIIQYLDSQDTVKVTLSWTPKISKDYVITIKAIPLLGEAIISNNILSNSITVSGFPDIHISRDSIEFEGDPGDILEETITLSNIGSENVNYLVLDESGFYIFFDDMEQGTDGWTHSGKSDSWEHGKPQIGVFNAHSGEMCWGTNLEGNYREFSNCSLVSPLIDLVDINEPILIFAQWYSIDPFSDRGYVEIWDGNIWHTLNPEGVKGYSGDWQYASFYLSNYSGLKVKVRFRLFSDEEVLDKGWLIDDVRVISPSRRQKDWLTESNSIGVIPPDSSNDVVVTAYTTGLSPGIHKENLLIRSNDPFNGLVTIPVSLLVRGIDDVSPIADAGVDIVIDEDRVVQFDASNSSDNFEISDYSWHFSDNDNITLEGLKPIYIFAIPGVYNVKLIVTDTSGNTAYDSVTVSVKDVTKPEADAGKDIFEYVQNSVILDGKKSTDNGEIDSYEWDLGDGTTTEGSEITYKYSKPGVYNVTLTVKDTEGNIDTDSIVVTIQPPEGSGFFLLLIFIIFIMVVTLVIHKFLIAPRKIKHVKELKDIEFYGRRRN